MWISWRSFMCEIMVRGWVAVTSSSHIPYCTPIHRYTLLLALWASYGLLWPFLSFSLAYLFLPRLGACPCALCIYWLDLWALGHCVILRLFFSASLLVSFLLRFASSHRIHFASVFPCVMVTRSRLKATSQACHIFRFTLKFWSRSFSLRRPFGFEIWGSFG